ncbi:MAG: hypothetical protein LBU26_05020, partial [Synergistaceae bacterium]|nr:hypothetical protein [Synergistaceae bacterium]
MSKKSFAFWLVLALLAFALIPFNGSAEAETDLGDGVSLLGSDVDPTSTVVKVKISGEQFAGLASQSYYLNYLNPISEVLYSKFKDDFDFLVFVLDNKDSSALSIGGQCSVVR